MAASRPTSRDRRAAPGFSPPVARRRRRYWSSRTEYVGPAVGRTRGRARPIRDGARRVACRAVLKREDTQRVLCVSSRCRRARWPPTPTLPPLREGREERLGLGGLGRLLALLGVEDELVLLDADDDVLLVLELAPE